MYPRCRENFQWLIRHFFLPKPAKRKPKAPPAEPAMQILEWLFITVRSWDVEELGEERDHLRASTEIHYPGLTHELEPVLRLVPKNCSSTLEAFGFACEITDIIRKYAHLMERQQIHAVSVSSGSSGQSDGQVDPAQAMQSLQNLLAAGADVFPGGLGEQLRQLLSSTRKQGVDRGQVAVATRKSTQPLTQDDINDSRQATTALRTRLQALMQSTRSLRNHSGYVGALDTRKLHTLAAGNTKIFLRKGEKISVNTRFTSCWMHPAP